MGSLDGRVAVITGAGRGLGREHALLMASEGAKIVVNDLGGAMDGSGSDQSAAQQVAKEITDAGGQAVANHDNIATMQGAKALVDQAVEAFGDLHVLVNNAGILRDRVMFNMTEEEWDAVINVHLKGHFAPAHYAANHWRNKAKAGDTVKASIINTSSVAGLMGNGGQTNYGAAKAGIAAMTMIWAKELGRYGVRSNAISPYARTRLTENTPGLDQMVKAPDDPNAFDMWHPGNVSPLVAYLATENCPFNGGVWHTFGNQVGLFEGWRLVDTAETNGKWTVSELESAMKQFIKEDRLTSEGTTDGDIAEILTRATKAAQQ